MSRSALAACAAVALLLFVVGLAGFASLVLGIHETHHQSFAAGREVRVQSGNGDVRVSTGPAGSSVQLTTRERHGPLATTHVRSRVVDGALRLASGCSGLGDCSVRFDVRVPRGARVRLQTGSGDIAGDLAASDVEARTGSGDVDLRVPNVRRLRMRTGSGDVDARVGPGPFAVRTQTGSGDEHVTVRTDPHAGRSIDARTGSGDVHIAPVS